MKRSRGIAALELLMVAPLLIILFLGIVSLTIAASLRSDLGMVARAGMQYAMYDLASSEDTAGIATATEAAAIGLSVTPAVDVTEWCACLDTATGALIPTACTTTSCPAADLRPHRYLRIDVTANYPYPWAIPGLPDLWQVNSRAEVRTR